MASPIYATFFSGENQNETKSVLKKVSEARGNSIELPLTSFES
jgi:hypothetical protein